MSNKDNVFIAVNEEVSSIIQQYIIREIKKVLDKYKSITTEEIRNVENLMNSISNEELKEEFLNDWSMSVKIAKEIGENEVDDRIISMYQNLKGNGLEELSIGHVINWCNELDEQGYVTIDDYSIIYKSSANLKDIAIELLDDMLDDAIHDIDAPYSMRKEKKVKNAMWTINEKIFNESRIKNGMDNMIIANMPDFEFQYFKYLQRGDKPYNAICELRKVAFINSDRYEELVNILESIISRKHSRSIKSIDDYYRLLSKYVKEEIPEPKEIWQLDEYKQAFKEVSVTEEITVDNIKK